MSTTPLPHTSSLFSLRSQGETTPSLPAGFRKIKNHPKTTILLMSFVVKCLYLFNRRSTAMNQLQLMFFFATIQLELPRLLWEIQDTLALPGTLQHTHASHRFRNPTIPSHPILQETTIPSLFSGLPNEG